MRLWMAAMMIGAVALPLAACDRQAADEEDGAAAPAVVETPKRKAGLWKQTMSIEGLNMVQTANLCLDADSDKKLAWWAQQGVRGGCDKNDVSRNPDGSWSFSSVCHLEGGMKTTTTGHAVGDFQRAYQVKAESTTEGAPIPAMNATRTVVIDSAWQGECPAGMQPGDMELPTGQRVNILQMSAENAAQPAEKPAP